MELIVFIGMFVGLWVVRGLLGMSDTSGMSGMLNMLSRECMLGWVE